MVKRGGVRGIARRGIAVRLNVREVKRACMMELFDGVGRWVQ